MGGTLSLVYAGDRMGAPHLVFGFVFRFASCVLLIYTIYFTVLHTLMLCEQEGHLLSGRRYFLVFLFRYGVDCMCGAWGSFLWFGYRREDGR